MSDARSTKMAEPRSLLAAAAAGALVLSGLVPATTATADPLPGESPGHRPVSDVRPVDERYHKQKTIKLSKAQQDRLRAEGEKVSAETEQQRRSASTESGTGGVPVGGEKAWLISDDGAPSGVAAANYTLMAIGDNIEVWVQSNLDYPEGDCRNDGVRNVVTREQAEYFADEFDDNILPKESEIFSVAPARDGSNQADVGFGAPLWEILGGGDPQYYVGDGEKTVALISNVRDANYYEPTSPEGATYTAGFFWSLFNEAFDRNIMTIDSYDWLHRTGENPPDEEPGGLCSPKQRAQPLLYEGTFAHEYQHLLQYYADGGETTWLNEGLSDYAQTVVGYVDSTLPYGETGADGHLTCYQGFYASESFPYCGAENSITRWHDQGATSTLSDYGAVYALITYIQNQFGTKAISHLHNSPEPGLASLQSYLDDHAPGLQTDDVINDFLAQMAVDRLIDDGAKGLTKDQKARFTADQLSSAIDWAWTGSYDSPGAPTNGADFVLGIADRPVNGNTIKKVEFAGATHYAPDPLAWAIDDNALHSGVGHNLDNTAVYDATVPADDPTLTISTKYNIEQNWDFGMVQVSTDGGRTYQSVAGTNTTTDHDPNAAARIVAELPGLSGLSDGFVTETYDLSDYAGQEIKLAFRYLTDAAVNGNNSDPSGWWIRDVTVGGTVITDGSTLDGARSATEVHPVPVEDWTLQAVGWSLDGKRVAHADIDVKSDGTAKLPAGKAKKLFKKADRIGFIVTATDSSEAVTKYANYTLTVNGVVQPGGGGHTDQAIGAAPAAQLPISSRRAFTVQPGE